MRANYRAIALLAGLLSFVGHSPAYAALESIDHINTLAKEFIENTVTVSPEDKLEVSPSQATNNIAVTQCGSPITVGFPPNVSGESATTVEMTCVGPQSWHIYVPIEVRVMTKVVVAKQPIAAKQEVTEDMLDYAQYDKNHLYAGFFKNMQDVVGQESVTTIGAGTIITRRGLQKPIIVHRNQNVAIIARSGAIMVKADGIAKSEGGINDMIKIFNPASKRMIDGIIVNSSTVEVS